MNTEPPMELNGVIWMNVDVEALLAGQDCFATWTDENGKTMTPEILGHTKGVTITKSIITGSVQIDNG